VRGRVATGAAAAFAADAQSYTSLRARGRCVYDQRVSDAALTALTALRRGGGAGARAVSTAARGC
jgi:hypothetical protein